MDRAWHVVVDHPGLAGTFKAFIANDFSVAAEHQAGSTPSERDIVPGLPSGDEVRSETFKQFFAAQSFTGPVTMTPLLTPDAGFYAPRILALIHSAQTNFWMQTQYISRRGVPARLGQPRNSETLSVIVRNNSCRLGIADALRVCSGNADHDRDHPLCLLGDVLRLGEPRKSRSTVRQCLYRQCDAARLGDDPGSRALLPLMRRN